MFLTNEGIQPNKSKSSWLIDSGCSMHMTSDLKLLKDQIESECNVRVADGRKLKSNIKGTIYGFTDNGKPLIIKKWDIRSWIISQLIVSPNT